MKTRVFLAFLLMLSCLFSCKKDDSVTLPEELKAVVNSIGVSMDNLEGILSAGASSLASTGVDSAIVRAKLVEMYAASSFAKEFAFITSEGIMQVIEPPAYYSFQGSDFSNDSQMMGLISTKSNALSSYFNALEGYGAVADMHAIVSNNTALGIVEGLFDPNEMMGSIINPVIAGQEFDIWVMEKEGKIICSVDSIDIGKNVFTDPYYASFTSFLEACDKISEEESGQTSYSFYWSGTTNVVEKDAYWDTYTHHGKEWKVVWVKAK